jgi:hypothetical protein
VGGTSVPPFAFASAYPAIGLRLTSNIEDDLIETELDARRLLKGFDS